MPRLFKNYALLLFTFLCILSACKKEEPLRISARNIDNVKEDFDAFTIKSGSQDLILEYINNQWWEFKVIAPEYEEGKTYPVVFHLHAASGGQEHPQIYTSCYLEPAFDGMEAIIISPNDNNQLWTAMSNQEMIIKLLLFAQEFWPVDESKIAVTGYGNGGTGSWFYAETQPSLFSAAIPMASSYSTIGTDGNPRLITTPIFAIHGEEDEHFPVDETTYWIDEANSVGSSINFIVAEGLDHLEPCEYAPYLTQAVSWLEDEIWQ